MEPRTVEAEEAALFGPRNALLFASFLATALLPRWALLWQTGQTPGRCDLAGIAADILAAGLVLAFTLLVARVSRIAALITTLPWFAINLANYEHIRDLGAPLRRDYLHVLTDPVFLRGSGIRFSHPLLTLLLLVALLLLAHWCLRRPSAFSTAAGLAGVAVVGLVALAQVPHSPSCLEWRRVHPVTALLLEIPVGQRLLPSSASMPEVLRADLDGSPWVDLGESHNVLLVVLEGVGGGFLPSLAAATGTQWQVEMPALQSIGDQSIQFRRFLNHQRQTNRGEYALLCGDLPKLTSSVAKLTELAAGPPLPCLPRLLADAGYETVYLQAAPLAFMLKGEALPRMGFSRVHGDTWFQRSYERSQWGVDDKAFFEQSLDLVKTLAESEEKWFLTLLNVGTHHPFTAPGMETSDLDPEVLAFRYLDEAVAAFWNGLEDLGVLDDTLVLVTSDEARGSRRSGTDLERALSQSWGLLVASVPGARPRVVDDVYVQSDIALSVSDYLSLEDPSGTFLGRSVFRHYGDPRPVFFANTYLHTVFGLFPDHRLYACKETMDSCSAWRLDAYQEWGSAATEIDRDPREVAMIRDVVHWSEALDSTTEKVYQLLTDRRIAVRNVGGPQVLFGGQYLEAKPDSVVEVEIDLEVQGTVGWVHLRHDLLAREQTFYTSRFPVLGPGDNLRLRYRLRPQRPLSGLLARGSVDAVVPGDLVLDFSVAKLVVRPEDADAVPGSVDVMEEAIQRKALPPRLTYTAEAISPTDLAPCVQGGGEGQLAVQDCPQGLVISGPRIYAPRGSLVELTSVARGKAGQGEIRWLLGTEEADHVLAQSRPAVVAGNEEKMVSLSAEIDATLSEIQAGLYWRPLVPGSSVSIDTLEITVVLP